MARRAKRLTKREAAVDAKEQAIAALSHRLASCFASQNWPRAENGMEEAAKLLHGALPSASPPEVARMAFVVSRVRALSGKSAPSPASVIVTLHLVAVGKLAPSLLEHLSDELRAEVGLFAPPLDAAWLEEVRATVEGAGAKEEAGGAA